MPEVVELMTQLVLALLLEPAVVLLARASRLPNLVPDTAPQLFSLTFLRIRNCPILILRKL